MHEGTKQTLPTCISQNFYRLVICVPIQRSPINFNDLIVNIEFSANISCTTSCNTLDKYSRYFFCKYEKYQSCILAIQKKAHTNLLMVATQRQHNGEY